jgi:hypothetical protein
MPPTAPRIIPTDHTLYNQIKPGRFTGELHLTWKYPDLFTVDNADQKFGFIRYNQQIITPQAIYTDGGSIPRLAWGIKDLSPWYYGPAFIIHDWIFEWHRHPDRFGACPYTCQDAADILAECLKTLMQDPATKCDDSPTTLWLVHTAVSSVVAEHLWNSTGLPLPPDPVA